jgi:hypothetical protein
MSAPRIRFLVGGVQKAGTSALAHYLGQHPALRLPRDKEAHVFDAPDYDEQASAEAVDERFRPLFDAFDDARLHGDATPISLLHPRFVARIARYNPDMRWIVLLRDPAERALSHYHMERDRGYERRPLWAAMLLERWRLRGHADDFAPDSPLRHHSYRLRGDYARQLDVLHASFSRDQVLLLDSRVLDRDPDGVLRRVCAFLGVDPLACAVQPQRVFVGAYAPTPPGAMRMRLLRWWIRRERRDARQRHGIAFDP